MIRALLLTIAACACATAATDAGYRTLQDPIVVYNDWSSYDELSDNVPLTEQLALNELANVLRLRGHGARFDYYMMDAFWFAKDGAYRTWRKETWPNGPDNWLKKCHENSLRPGMWFGTNVLVQLDAAPEWKDSLNKNGSAMCMFRGGFLPHFIDTLQMWYNRGVRMFEFDFADFTAAPPDVEASMPKQEIVSRNQIAFRDALKEFRRKNPGIVLVAFNGFGGDLEMTSGPFPFKDPIDLNWLSVFDTLYCGDPRPSDVPMMNFWRSQDLYSDHMVRRYQDSGVPLERIDPTSAMYGATGTIYNRKISAWKSGLLLTLSRGGWIDTIHGNMELIDDGGADWMAHAFRLFLPLEALGRTKIFGGVPGDAQPYGFASLSASGSVYTVINPAQAVNTVELPRLSQEDKPQNAGRVLFTDAGFRPILSARAITLGPEQMAVVGFGAYGTAVFDLGVENDVVIPQSIEPVPASFAPAASRDVEATVTPSSTAVLRIVLQQRTPDGFIRRTWAGGPPKGENMANVLKIEAFQDGRALPVKINYGKVIWSGLSWGVGEVKPPSANRPVRVRCSSAEKDPVKLEVRLYKVQY